MLTQLDLGSVGRIGNVVRIVEGQYPRAKPLSFGVILGEPVVSFGGQLKTFRIAQFSGAWNKPNTKTVNLVNDTSRTAAAVNLFANIPAPSGGSTAHCAIAREGSAWYLIAAEC